MNVDEAIAVHVEWKEKLTQYLNQPDGSLDALAIAADDRCPLGQWLHGEGRLLTDFRAVQRRDDETCEVSHGGCRGSSSCQQW